MSWQLSTGQATATPAAGRDAKRAKSGQPGGPEEGDAHIRFVNDVARLSLNTAQRERELEAKLPSSVMNADHPLALALDVIGRNYAKDIREGGENHGKGPPHLHKGQGVLMFLQVANQQHPPPERYQKFVKAIEQTLKDLATMTPSEAELVFSTCRMKSMIDKPGKTSTVRLHFSSDTMVDLTGSGPQTAMDLGNRVPLEEAVRTLLRFHEIKQMSGPPGPTMTEKRVSNSLSTRLGAEPRFK